jgi:hypothetical protein
MPSATQTKTSRVLIKDPDTSSDEESFNGFASAQNSAAEEEIDEEEEELERLVFGDAAGFRKGIRGFKTSEKLAKGKEVVLANAEGEEETGTGTGLEAIDDADVCCAFAFGCMLNWC